MDVSFDARGKAAHITVTLATAAMARL